MAEADEPAELLNVPENTNKTSNHRQECLKSAAEVGKIIENLSVTHSTFLTELKTQLEYSRLEAMQSELKQGLSHLSTEHDRHKATLGTVEPDRKLVNQVDRVAEDNKMITERVEEYMNRLSVKPKATNNQNVQSGNQKQQNDPSTASEDTHVVNDSSTNEPSKGLESIRDDIHSIHGSHSVRSWRSSRSSTSHRSGSSRSSQSMRLRLAEAAVTAATKTTQLNAEIRTQKLQEQKLRIESEITQNKMLAEIEAANQSQRIYAQAIAEEEEDQLMRPPSDHAEREPIQPSPQLAAAPVIPDTNRNSQNQHNETDAVIQTAPNSTEHSQPAASRSLAINELPYQAQHDVQGNQLIMDAPIRNPNLNLTSRHHVVIPSPDPSPISLASSHEALGESLAVAMSSWRMKLAEPPVFSGDPLQYVDWKVAFEGLVEVGRKSPLERLTLLKQYLDGKAKEAVASLFRVGTEEAYRDAKRKLDRRFGRPEVISEAFRFRLERWQPIKEEDGEGLEELTDFLESCQTAMLTIPELRCLGDRRENMKILGKLPTSVARRWVTRATHIEKSTNAFPTFDNFCKFLSEESDVATNPLSRSLSRQSINPPQRNRPHNNHERKLNSLNTNTSNTPESNEPKQLTKRPCLKCDMTNHRTSDCNQLAKLTRDEQLNFIKAKGLCYCCLNKGHISSECKTAAFIKCRKPTCEGSHATVFHDYIVNKRTEQKTYKSQPNTDKDEQNLSKSSSPPKQENERSTNNNKVNTGSNKASVLSWIIPVYVSSANDPDNEVLVNALIDSGSDTTFITNTTLNHLDMNTLHTTDLKLKMSTLSNTEGQKIRRKQIEGLRIRGLNMQKIIELPPVCSQLRIPTNANQIPTALSVEEWPHLRHLANQLIPRYGKEMEIGLLLGGDISQVFIPREVIVRGDQEPWAKLTDLGWCIMGHATADKPKQVSVTRTVNQALEKTAVSFRVKTDTPDPPAGKVLELLQQDFSIGFDDGLTSMSTDDKMFLDILQGQICKDEEGYITMPLPFKTKPPTNNSRKMAEARFSHLQKKLGDPVYAGHYHDFMSKILKEGDAEKVPENELNDKDSWYIPHFGVYHPKKPGKIRVVFDCAAKSGGTCLNDFLLQGPDLMNSLLGILMRFRREKVAVICDVERMFHQFRVPADQRNYLRFHWFNDQGEVTIYRMKVHLFGAKSSPGCATYGLRALGQLSDKKHPESVRNFINQDFYVDDGLTSVPTVIDAQELVTQAVAICQEGNLRLHKFSSNSKDVLSALPQTERCIEDIQILDPDSDVNPTERTLGITWAVKPDCFKFDSVIKSTSQTRRGILSAIASIYDPLGFISPYILQGKNILQEMCKVSCGWDDPLSEDIQSRWEQWKSDLNDLSTVSIDRCYKPAGFGELKKAEIHNFSDASIIGHGAVSYLRLVNTAGRVHCSLLMSKARVAPIKSTTIPRLELQAAVTAIQLNNLAKRELGIPTTETFWTDSQVVLGYIKNSTKRFKIYVANRVQQIRDFSSPNQWYYIPTSVNPADHASRGLHAKQLPKSNWFRGPDFLWQEPISIPEQPKSEVQPDDVEVKCLLNQKADHSLAQRLERFSNWKTAVKVTGTFLAKLYAVKKMKVDKATMYRNIVTQIIKSTQEDSFSELTTLKNGKQIERSSPIFNLNPFLDDQGVMRVGGRLKYSASLEYEEKHPAILPRANHITGLLIRYLHESIAHQGRGMTLAKVRASGYWILNAKGIISSLVHHCVICRRLRGKPTIPQMNTLPEPRVTPQPPFTCVGIDCFGPFIVKERRTELKRYGLMVTCLASRAVHIEVLDDLSTTSFINGLRNVTSLRGRISEIRCDRGTNFVGAISELSEKGVMEFRLNPPGASHMGGVWERNIRTARNVLKGVATANGGRLDTSGLRTLFYEVMAIINSRPLSTVTEEQVPLTPNLLLTMKSEVILSPPGEFEPADLYARKRWRAVQHLANVFWHRWKSEYLSELQARQKWVRDTPNVSVGAVVLIKDEDMIRNKWTMGKVVECIKSKDSRVRSVKLLLGNPYGPTKSDKFLIRPVSKVIVLVAGVEADSTGQAN